MAKNSITNLILAACGGAGIAMGLNRLADHYSAINSIRNAVYAHADKITPEIIAQADKLVSQVNQIYAFMGIFDLAVASFALYTAYSSQKKLSIKP